MSDILYAISPTPCDKKCCTEHHTLFLLSVRNCDVAVITFDEKKINKTWIMCVTNSLITMTLTDTFIFVLHLLSFLAIFEGTRGWRFVSGITPGCDPHSSQWMQTSESQKIITSITRTFCSCITSVSQTWPILLYIYIYIYICSPQPENLKSKVYITEWAIHDQLPFWKIFKYKENHAIVCIAQTYNYKKNYFGLYPKNNYTKSYSLHGCTK